MCPDMFEDEEEQIDEFVKGLPVRIQENVSASAPTSMQKASQMAHKLMGHIEGRNKELAHRTTPKRSNGETPYSLVYGTEAVLPAVIQALSNRTENTKENEENLHLNLDLAEERRESALIREASYKKSIERYYNKRVKRSTFKVGDYVLRLNSTIKVEYEEKLGANWEGPYVISQAFGNGSYKLETTSGKAIPRTWNGVNLRRFYF
ncbi:uncharacterized protein [Rutidosis leptorrhynchoides]|uniref:uncharacterized protein n=1 Tax=Rutidosis leptorrhynchoides TaxID=125765 RepID=UPI003A99F659